jgi:excisionase family DNA binding protein
METQYLKTKDIAKIFNVSRDAVIQWIYQGVLKAIRTPGGLYRIPIEEVENLKEKFKLENVQKWLKKQKNL